MLDQLLNAQEGPEPDDDAPPLVMVASTRRVTLSNGRSVDVRIMRPEGVPWTAEDETALRAILDVAAAVAGPPRSKRGPRLVVS